MIDSPASFSYLTVTSPFCSSYLYVTVIGSTVTFPLSVPTVALGTSLYTFPLSVVIVSGFNSGVFVVYAFPVGLWFSTTTLVFPSIGCPSTSV